MVVKVSEQINRQNNTAYVNKFWGDAMYNAPIYGVVPGGTDVTEKLQALIDQAIEEGRRAIYFPAGEYYVTSLTDDDQVDFFGDNASFTGGYTGTIRQMGDWASSAQLADIALHLKTFGADATGTVDSTAAIQAALDSDYDVFSNSGDVYLFSDTLRCSSEKNLNLQGLMVYTGPKDKPAFIYGKYAAENGGTAYRPSKRKILLNIKSDGSYTENHADPDFVLVTLINLWHCDVDLNTEGGYAGVLCRAELTGFSHNNIRVRALLDAMRHLILDSTSNGYVNENIFSNGSYANSADNPDRTDSIAVSIISSDGAGLTNSNNEFMKPSFATRGGQPIYTTHSQYNFFREVRAENGTPLKDYVLTTQDTNYVVVDVGYVNDSGASVEFPWTGRSVIASPQERFIKANFISLYDWSYNPSDVFFYRIGSGSEFYRARVRGLDVINASTTTVLARDSGNSGNSTTLVQAAINDVGLYGGFGQRSGVWVDARMCKYFVVRITVNDWDSVSSGVIQPTFKPFDANGDLIEGDSNALSGILAKPVYAPTRFDYDPSSRTLTFGVKLSDNVKTLFVGVRSDSGDDRRLKSFRLFGTQQAEVWTTQKFGLPIDYYELYGTLSVGDYIPNLNITEETDDDGTYVIRGFVVRSVDVDYKLTTVADKFYLA